jgi:hypothetical protein
MVMATARGSRGGDDKGDRCSVGVDGNQVFLSRFQSGHAGRATDPPVDVLFCARLRVEGQLTFDLNPTEKMQKSCPCAGAVLSMHIYKRKRY